MLAQIGRAPKAGETAAQLVFTAAVVIAVGLQALHAAKSPDFAMIWAAQHTVRPYSIDALNAVLGSGGHYFPYPPTVLVLTLPLRLAPYTTAYLAWLVLSAWAIVGSLRALAAPLVLAVPAVFLAAIDGQTSLFMAALLITGVTCERPLAAGVLYGLAACVKPQVGLLIPLFLLSSHQWRSIAAAILTVLIVGLISILTFGVGAWSAWWSSLPGFLAANDAVWRSRYLSLPGAWALVALGLGSLGAVVAARTGEPLLACFICVGSALLGSLHAMDYDEAILAPFAVRAAVLSGPIGLAYLVPLAFPPNRLATLALTLLAGAALGLKLLRRQDASTPGSPTPRGRGLRADEI